MLSNEASKILAAVKCNVVKGDFNDIFTFDRFNVTSER